MNLTEKIEELKRTLNHDGNIFVRQNLDVSDYTFAIITALREIANHAKIITKTAFMPLCSNKVTYPFVLSNLITEPLTFNKTESLDIRAYSATEGGVSIAPINIETIQKVAELWNSNLTETYAMALRVVSSNMYFNAGNYFADHTLGHFTKVTEVSGINVKIDGTAPGHKYAMILNVGDSLIFPKIAEITAYSTFIEMSNIYQWENIQVNDKIYIADTIPSFFGITFKAVPSLDYFNTNTDLAILETWEGYISPLAYHYLYMLLVNRRPEMLKQIQAIFQLGLLEPKKSIISQIRRKANSIDNYSPTVKSYQPFE